MGIFHRFGCDAYYRHRDLSLVQKEEVSLKLMDAGRWMFFQIRTFSNFQIKHYLSKNELNYVIEEIPKASFYLLPIFYSFGNFDFNWLYLSKFYF